MEDYKRNKKLSIKQPSPVDKFEHLASPSLNAENSGKKRERFIISNKNISFSKDNSHNSEYDEKEFSKKSASISSTLNDFEEVKKLGDGSYS